MAHIGRTICFAAVTAAFVVTAHAQDQQRRRQPGWPCAGTIDPSYVRTAEATGGQVMLFKPTEVVGAAAESSASMRHEQVVFRGSGEFAEGAHEFEMPLDSTIESAYFFVSMHCLQGVVIVSPSGDELRTDAAGVEYHHFEAIRLFTIPQPAPGLWKVRIAGRGFLSLIVKAKTSLRLTGVAFPNGGIPLKREPRPQRLEATMSGAASQIAFAFISSSAATIEPLDLALEKETGADRTYGADVMPPNAEFRVAMTGVDAQGFRFQRVQKQLFVTER